MSDYAHLLPVSGKWKRQVEAFLEEDVPGFDIGAYVVGSLSETAHLLMKLPGLVCGKPFADHIFALCNLQVEWLCCEGQEFGANDIAGKRTVAIVKGRINDILLAERTALNLLSRASGIALALRATVNAARSADYRGIIAGTRKTTPGLRVLEKYAMVVGGADPHRYDLSHMVMLKDNHIASCESITGAVSRARAVAGFSTKIDVEVDSYENACEAIEAGADVVMLDNFSPTELRLVSKRLKEKYRDSLHAYLLECLGGLTLGNLDGYLCPSIDIYSTSSIHQGCGVVDFSLKICPKQE